MGSLLTKNSERKTLAIEAKCYRKITRVMMEDKLFTEVRFKKFTIYPKSDAEELKLQLFEH